MSNTLEDNLRKLEEIIMFVEFEVGDRVFHRRLNQEGTVVQVKSTFCVVKLDDGKEVSPHKVEIAKVRGKDEGKLTLDGAYKEVREFQKAMEQPYLDSPEAMPKERRVKRAEWLKEEGYDEFLEADELVDQVDALTDALYIILGSFNEIGVKPTVPFEIVQRANMGKLDSKTGKPAHNEQGKVVKPEGWYENYAPEKHLQVEIDRQIKAAEGHE